MSGERVKIIEGRRPILVLAPHGYNQDDENTAMMVEHILRVNDGYGVLNLGWERSDQVDYLNDKADCNNVLHCLEDPVKDEFLEPVLRFKNRILKKYHRCYVFLIHGMGNHHRKSANDPTLDIVLGYGRGSPDSLTCEEWIKNAFYNLLDNQGMVVYQGRKGGSMSGWARQNMNQLFRKHYPDSRVQTMQIEIIHEMRKSLSIAETTADSLGLAMLDLLSANERTTSAMNIPEY